MTKEENILLQDQLVSVMQSYPTSNVDKTLKEENDVSKSLLKKEVEYSKADKELVYFAARAADCVQYLHPLYWESKSSQFMGMYANIQLRYVVGGMICLACMINYIVRGNMSIIILAMTEPLTNTTEKPPDYGPRYHWSAYDQSLVIGSYFWGTVSTTIIAGIFAERYGPRKVAGLGIILATILSGFAPVGAKYLWLTIIIRFVTGMAMATNTPSMQALIANWAPPEEKGKFLSALSANGIGTVIDWSMSGYIIEYLGWPYAFYIVAVILAIFIIPWFLIIYDSPKRHPRITTKEKDFILDRLITSEIKKKKPWPPVKRMLLSVPFWALVLLHFGCLFVNYIFLTATPRYLSEVHHFKISSTGVLSSLPYLVRFLGGIGFGFIGDFLFTRKIMSSSAIRKYFTICSHFIPAGFLIGLSFVGNRPYVCIAFITIALGFCGALVITSMQNPHDLAPNFATTIFAFIHTVGSTSGFIAPLMVAYFTKGRSTEEEWRNVFYVGAGMLIGSAIIFMVFGSGQIQKWNKITEDEDKTNDVLSSDVPSK